MGWKIGDRAYCVKRGPWTGYDGTPRQAPPDGFPLYGCVYLVAGLREEGGHLGLELAGFLTPRPEGELPPAYHAKQFRKIVPRSETAGAHEKMTS